MITFIIIILTETRLNTVNTYRFHIYNSFRSYRRNLKGTLIVNVRN